MSRKVSVARVASSLVCLVAADAMSQSVAVPPDSGDAGEVQTITVTAQKRKEDVRKVPLSVSVLTADMLQNNLISDFSDITRNVPNVSFTTQAGAGLGTIEMRGISSQAGTATVAVYLDDVSLTTRNLYSQGTAEPRFFDLDRVEVLRGPQGTLYGASALGGTMKFISRQPDAKAFSGYGTIDVSTTQHGGTNYQVEGVVNVPLVQDRIALRVGVQSGHESGYIDQVDPNTLGVIAKGINSDKWDVAKLALKADLGGGWSVTPALFAQYYKMNDIDAAFLKVGNSGAGYEADSPFVDQSLPLFQTSKTVREPGTDRLTVPSLTVAGDLGFADFTGVLSGYNRSFDRTQDGTYINSTYIGYLAATGNTLLQNGPLVTPNPALGDTISNLPSAVLLSNKVAQTSLEMRLASKDYDATKTPLTWIGGLFLSKTKTQVYDNEPIYGLNSAFAAAGVDPTDPTQFVGGFANDFPGDNSYYSARHYDDKQESIFGELTWHFSPALRAIAGLRLLHATQDFTREGNYYFADGPSTAAIDSTFHATTPRFAIDWDVTPTTTLYTNIAKGFRLGGANRPIPNTGVVQSDLASLGLPGAPPATFAPDSLWSYEVGSKSRFWGGRLLLNTSLYYINWSDIQQDVTLPTSGFDFETNVGKAQSYGLEVDGRYKVTDALTVTASWGLTHATFSEDVPALGVDGNGNYNVHKGDYIQGVPLFNAQLGFDYHFPVTGNVSGVVRGNGQWTGTSHGSLFAGDTDYQRNAYFTADASAGISWSRWELTLYVKNLNNDHTILQQPSIQGVDEAYYLRPRTIGLRLSADI